jgi:hypothetical protein
VGVFLGDHTKTAIGTLLNTGTVVGFSANVVGTGFPTNHIPSFSWGGAQGLEAYDIEKAIAVASGHGPAGDRARPAEKCSSGGGTPDATRRSFA